MHNISRTGKSKNSVWIRLQVSSFSAIYGFKRQAIIRWPINGIGKYTQRAKIEGVLTDCMRFACLPLVGHTSSRIVILIQFKWDRPFLLWMHEWHSRLARRVNFCINERIGIPYRYCCHCTHRSGLLAHWGKRERSESELDALRAHGERLEDQSRSVGCLETCLGLETCLETVFVCLASRLGLER